MNIGFYMRKVSLGGGERRKLTFITELIKKGHKIFIYFHDPEEISQLSVPFEKIILKKKKNSIIQAISDIFAILKTQKDKNIHCQIQFGISSRFIISSYLNKVSSIIFMNVDPMFVKKKLKLWVRTLISFLLSNGIIFQTQKIRNRYSKRIQAKSVVIPNPIMDDFLPIPLKVRKYKVVSIGRLSEEKNYPLLINAFSNISPNDYTLHIYGDGPLKSYLQDLIVKLRMEDKIFLEGHVNRVVDKISDAEIFVLCSNFEGMPNALIEAMAIGLACISTKFPSGAAEELIQNYENGILIQVGNQKQLELSISSLIEDKNLSAKLRNNAQYVRKALDKNMIINQWLKYIEKYVK
jgi:GalNAc-alpha-(1->4)-GalNAc-alpha-(1->3)-diNAcBac-PP-undecaprenol alpha-1,4-N-acetyl-D-galactosaminyltransferase